MTITFESIVAEHQRVAAMIAEFKAQSRATEFRLPAATIPLAPGERYAGLVLGEDGKQDYHLILLPSAVEDVTWQAACEWADVRDASLPTRREQSLLFANLKDEFESAWYWSGEQHEENAGWAWCQDFFNGDQIITVTTS